MGRLAYFIKCRYLPDRFSPFLQIYHDSSEREPDGRSGDDSRPEEFRKLAELSQSRFLIRVYEALGLTYDKVLTCSFPAIEAMMQEYAYICNERNKAMKHGDEDGGEWIELPDWDNPTKMVRIRKVDDVNLGNRK